MEEKVINQEEENTIITRHRAGEDKYNVLAAFLELDKRVSMLETAMGYLAEVERKKMGIHEQIEGLIVPETPKIITSNEL